MQFESGPIITENDKQFNIKCVTKATNNEVTNTNDEPSIEAEDE